MRKNAVILILTFLALIISADSGFCQQKDIAGTWVGETDVPDAPEPDEFTLVISKKDGVYNGVISDSLGMADHAECMEFEYVEAKISFYFAVSDGYNFTQVMVELEVKDNFLEGSWEDENGNTGTVVMQRQK